MQQSSLVRRFSEEVAAPAHEAVEGHDFSFAQRIDRRIGDLSEALAEVGMEGPRSFESTASGASSPIDQVGSWPSAMGLTIRRRSSAV